MSPQSLHFLRGRRLLALGAFVALSASQASGCPLCQAGYAATHRADSIGVDLAPTSGSALNLNSSPVGGYHIGLDFLTSNVDPGASFLFDFQPFALTAPSNNFVTQGAFAGRTATDIQRHIALAVEDAFRSLPGLLANEFPSIAIHLGRVPTDVAGRRLNVAIGQSSSPSWTLLGEALQSTYANDSIPNDAYVAAAYVDEIDRLGASFVTYNAFDGAVNAIAGTIAHEVGHVFGAEHVTITGNEPAPLPLMAIEATGLPTAARVTERHFDLLPQHSPANATRILSNADTVLQADFNFDGVVDAADIGVLFAGFGLDDRLYIEGDATGDHLVDAADIGRVFANFTTPPSAAYMRMIYAAVPEPSSLTLTAAAGIVGLGYGRRRRRG